jgi:type VI secretion system protein ImpL
MGTTGATEFTIEIDGQALRWRGQPQPYVHMVWPNLQGKPGARISAITPDGRTVVLLDEPSTSGLKNMLNAAKKTVKGDKLFELSWNNSGVVVTANLKITGKVKLPAAPAPAPGQGFKRMKLPESIIAAAATGAAQ